MLLLFITQAVLGELSDAIRQLDEHTYTTPIAVLSHATIGHHTRHTIELFECLIRGYDAGTVNYDLRQRNKQLESSPRFALGIIASHMDQISVPDKDLMLESGLGSEIILTTHTTYYRELLYNLEHAVHHMAIIRIGIESLTDLQLPESFGVAPSTMKYRRQCAP